MICNKCGSDTGDSKYCPNCGSSAESGPSTAKYLPRSAEGGKRVSKIAYGVLAILLGGLGIHKFYGGRIVLGIIYLIFCWTFIPAFLGLIEGIIALCKKADADGTIVVPEDRFFV